MNDQDLARQLYRLVGAAGDDSKMAYTVIPGPPHSKARVRFARGGRTYMTTDERLAEQRTGEWIKKVVPTPFTGNVAVGCIFYRPNRQRIDVDNLLKHIFDSSNGVAWIDDCQVTTVFGRLEMDAAHPRTLVVFAADSSSLQRGTDAWFPCPVCGEPIAIKPNSLRKTCSRECAARARGFEPLHEPIPCRQCGEPFKRTTRAQTMCSPECRADYLRDRRRGSAKPKPPCVDCGVILTNSRGGRCRDCWKAMVAAGKLTGGGNG